jgi:hypothetical protein
MITEEEKIRIKEFLLEKGIESEFIFGNHIAVSFQLTIDHRNDQVQFWKAGKIARFWYWTEDSDGKLDELVIIDRIGRKHTYCGGSNSSGEWSTIEYAIKKVVAHKFFNNRLF